jgi:hypothetical protein
MANAEHLETLKKGVTTWNQWMEKIPGIIGNPNILEIARADLLKAHMFTPDLSGADLSGADFHRTKPDRGEPQKGEPVAGELLFSPGTEHVTLLHSVLGLARIELVIADSKGIGAG